jgi:probable rRNA maturation factor
MSIVITNRQRARKIRRQMLKQIATALLADLEVETAEIGICLVTAAEMTRLNETFLRHAGSTDVITFDYLIEGRAGSPLPADRAHGVSRPKVHGEIFVCVEEAVLQAHKYGTSWQSEIVRYIIHGILHLLGFDDADKDARHRMKREERRVLRGLSRRFSLAQLSRPARIST